MAISFAGVYEYLYILPVDKFTPCAIMQSKLNMVMLPLAPAEGSKASMTES